MASKRVQARTRSAFPHCSGAKLLLRACVYQPVATMLSVQDLAHLCAATPHLRLVAADLVRAAMEAQHGLIIPNAQLDDLRALEDVPERCTIDCHMPGARRVRRGSPLSRTFVGSNRRITTEAQSPPACGDAWSVRVELKKGTYSLEMDGWQNPSHGLLTVFCDGVLVGTFDWSGSRTRRLTHTAILNVRWTGSHQILAATTGSNAELCRQRRYWMCLRSFSVG